MNNRIKLELMSLSQNESLARAVAAAFITPLDPTLEELADVRTAVSEAITNAIIHGYRNTSGIITMLLELDGKILTVAVEDKGCGIEDIELAKTPFYTSGNGGERSGMGFAVMQAFMDSLEVISAPGSGTTVIMKKTLSSSERIDGRI